ncbi:variant erythrocyte surface antigen-1 beta subunit [Babesia bovis T2Bo]|uniref:variant erythrocyte surface antigen-1 beta subunit n=1 Tax=Babesia bovis T2Bo TaxID=484906 RepID=UPI001C35D609|nr:variant erythrocyte surface antigen-1 beta subunit [Babesia bovis T2Bo]EDO08330.2 variant erythrocyte surface antigen-1 beta subunit [Babesia bovis T2Bo]
MSTQSTWPYSSLTQAPTNLKEAIDWVLRVTGKDGRKNDKAAASPPQFGCICFLAKAVKDLLYDAKDPGSPGPSPDRYWDDLLLEQEKTIVQPVLTDLGLLSGSTSAARDTCAGGTEVVGTLIDQLAQGLQKWVGWQEKGDECCLKGTEGIGKKCECTGGGAGGCCTGSSGTCTCASANNCYKSAYSRDSALWTTIVNGTTGGAGGSGSAGSAVGGKGGSGVAAATVDTVKAAQEVHLLARIFLGSVCLIWSGLSQLGFLTGKGSSRWENSSLHSLESGDKAGLGSFMAAMGYDLERLNQGKGGGSGKTGSDVWNLLSGTDPNGSKGIQWNEFKKDPSQKSVAEYYSTIYGSANKAEKNSEKLCKDYPLLVLHILASGYFRAGSAGAKGVTTPAKAATSDPRKPRTIREILYWLSALPYSQGYRELVERMQGKMEGQEQYKLESTEPNNGTTLLRDNITHYLMAACGYCPLVLIGIQGTIEREVVQATASGGVVMWTNGVVCPGGAGAAAQSTNKCPNHSKDPTHKRCTLDDKDKAAEAAAPAAGSAGKALEKGEVCYGGYHLEVSQFGPLHGMYANGLFGFQMDISTAQCLDQLRIYVHHCFYQLYFLRKQCSTGVVGGASGSGVAVGWSSCRYGSGVYWGSGYSQSNLWRCKTEGAGGAGDEHTKQCGLQSGAGGKKHSPLMCFLCDGLHGMCCFKTVGRGNIDEYPSIEDHMNMESPIHPKGHLDKQHGHCPVPMGWSTDGRNTTGETHFKDLTKGTHKTDKLEDGKGSASPGKYPAHCTGNTLSLLLEYYCDPEQCSSGTLVVLLRLLACITPTVPRTLGDLFGFYYYIVYIGGKSGGGQEGVHQKLKGLEGDVRLGMKGIGNNGDAVVEALTTWNNSGICSGGKEGHLKCLTECDTGSGAKYLSPLSGQQYGQLSPAMAGTYLSWLVYLIGEFKTGLEGLEEAFREISCKVDGCKNGAAGAGGCGPGCTSGTHGDPCPSGGTGGGNTGVCKCHSVVSCTGVLPVLYKYGFGYGNVTELHKGGTENKKCDAFLTTLKGVLEGDHIKHDGTKGGLHHEINKLIYTTRLPWIFVLTVAWLVAVLYLAFGAIWPLDWTHMRSHCRGLFRKGSLSPWEVLMVGKKKGRGILEFFGKT